MSGDQQQWQVRAPILIIWIMDLAQAPSAALEFKQRNRFGIQNYWDVYYRIIIIIIAQPTTTTTIIIVRQPWE